MKRYMCFDIGGTSVKFGVAGESGALLHKGEIPNVITQKGVDGLVESLASVMEQYQQEYRLYGIAVSTAGVVDPEKGLILYAPKYFPGYPGTALGERLEKRCGLPCTVENDVNAALQHITPECTWEEMASTRALVRNVAKAKGFSETALDGRKIFALALDGDEEAAAAIARQMDDLATGIANICYILNPERIIVGGGIAAQEAYLYPLLDTALRDKLLPLVYEKLTLRFAALQNDAGILGALYNFLMRQ